MRTVLTLAAVIALTASLAADTTNEESAVDAIRAVEREGVGNEAAAKAWKILADGPPETVLTILKGYDSKKPLVANWLRTAADAVAEKAAAAKKSLPDDELAKFVDDRAGDPGARRLAYDLLVRGGAKDTARFLKTDDPSRELRRDAVALEREKADALLAADKKTEAEAAYLKLFAAARDRDQVDAIAGVLEKEFGKKQDLPKHFGFITRWYIIAPFDNDAKAGFLKPFAPETEAIDTTKPLKGKAGEEVSWKLHSTADAHGVVDLNKLYKNAAPQPPAPTAPGGKDRENLHSAVAYAYAVIDSPQPLRCQVRVGSNNAVRAFVNGKPVISRESYHMGDRMDQYVGTVELKRGRNEVLLKVCQNDQDDDWAQKWSFQLRLCDEVGGAVPFEVIDPKADGK